MTTDSADASPSFDVQAELNELRRGLLPILLLPILPICWAMFFYIILKTGQISYNAIPLALLVLAVGLVLVLRGKHYALACWTLLIAMTVAISLTVWAHPASLAIAYGVLVIVAASALRRRLHDSAAAQRCSHSRRR